MSIFDVTRVGWWYGILHVLVCILCNTVYCTRLHLQYLYLPNVCIHGYVYHQEGTRFERRIFHSMFATVKYCITQSMECSCDVHVAFCVVCVVIKILCVDIITIFTSLHQ